MLTNKRGGRQTQGTLTVGSTWNRAAAVAKTGSFEIKSGGTTAAVEGTAFAMSCSIVNAVKSCKIIDVVDNVKVSIFGGPPTQLTPATSLDVTNDTAGTVTPVSYEELVNNPLIVSNLYLDFLVGKGLGGDDLPPAPLPPLPPLLPPPPPQIGQSAVTVPPEVPTTQPTVTAEPSEPSEPSEAPTIPTVPNLGGGPISVPQPPPSICVPSNTNPC